MPSHEVSVAFSRPPLTRTRIRVTSRGKEAVVPFTDDSVVYVMRWGDLRRHFPLNQGDAVLHDEVDRMNYVSAATVARAKRRIAAEGLWGEDARILALVEKRDRKARSEAMTQHLLRLAIGVAPDADEDMEWEVIARQRLGRPLKDVQDASSEWAGLAVESGLTPEGKRTGLASRVLSSVSNISQRARQAAGWCDHARTISQAVPAEAQRLERSMADLEAMFPAAPAVVRKWASLKPVMRKTVNKLEEAAEQWAAVSSVVSPPSAGVRQWEIALRMSPVGSYPEAAAMPPHQVWALSNR